MCNIKNKQISECSCIMCPVEKIEPGPKSYDLIPHPPFMYFNKIKGTSSLSCILIKKKSWCFYMFFRFNFCFVFKYVSEHIGEWIMVWGCMQWGLVLLANESKKESESSTKNHNVVILSGFDVLNFVIIVNVFGDCFGCLWWKKKKVFI